MATSPLYIGIPKSPIGVKLTTANTNLDGTGTTYEIYTGASSGSMVYRLKMVRTDNNLGTVVRLFRNNGSSPAVPANNSLIGEFNITPLSIGGSAASPAVIWTINEPLQPGYKLICSTHGTLTNGLIVSPIVGDF